MDSFTLEGWRYYQEYRRCGKPTCTTCQEGRGHGPYWYKRNPKTGKREYIGKRLKADVTRARRVLAAQKTRMALQSKQLELEQQLAAVRKLRAGEALTEHDRRRLSALGFGGCLVLPGVQITAQDGPIDVVLRELGYSTLPGIE